MSEEKHTHVHVLEDGTVIEHSTITPTGTIIQIQKQS